MIKNNNEKNKYIQPKNIITSLIFVAFIVAFFVVGIMLSDREFSENENRYLAIFPSVSLSNILSGNFSNEFETYVQDQFPLRDSLMPLKSNIDILAGKKDNSLVYFGDNGYLFSIEEIDTEQLKKNIGYINKFCAGIDPNIKCDAIIIPTASEVLNEYLPDNAVVPDERAALDTITNEINCNSIDVEKTLDKNKAEYVYYRTDHHWTTRGAYYAYEIFSGKKHSLSDYEIKVVSDKFYGTNYSKALLNNIKPDTITKFDLKDDDASYTMTIFKSKDENATVYDSLYDNSYLNKKDKYSFFLSGNNPLTVIERTAANKTDKNILVIKDSFAHCFIPFIASDYDKTVVVDMRYYRNNLTTIIDEYGITDILIMYNVLNFAQDKNLVFLNK